MAGARDSLTRFDTLVYFSCLEAMIHEGDDEDKFFASTVLLKCKHADVSSISTIMQTGLGRMSAERNETTKVILVGLPHRFYPIIFKSLTSILSHTNWRLRSDCLDLIDRCIRTLAGNVDKTVPADFNSIPHVYEKSVSNAVQEILELMWYDWSEEVRSQATSILGMHF
jgi:hypothetical protein